MECSDFEKDIFLFSEISDEQKVALKLHLENCANCSTLFNEVVKMDRLVKEMAIQEIVPANAAKLTSRIMEEIHSSTSVSWSDRVINILQNGYAKIALASVSTILLFTFSLEFFNDEPPIQYQNPITSGFAILNSTLFKEETARQRSKANFFADCVSPFKSQNYLIDCAKSKLK